MKIATSLFRSLPKIAATSVSQRKSKQNKGKKFVGLNSNPGKSKVIQEKIPEMNLDSITFSVLPNVLLDARIAYVQ